MATGSGLSNLARIGIVVLVAVIIFVVAANITQTLHDDQVTTLTETVNNESITLSNGTAVFLAHQNVVAASESIRTENQTLLIRGKEYRINNGSGSITLTYIVYNNNVSNITYQKTRESRNAAANASDSGNEFVTNVTNNFGLLGTVIVFGVIIAAVMTYLAFGRGKRRGGGIGMP